MEGLKDWQNLLILILKRSKGRRAIEELYRLNFGVADAAHVAYAEKSAADIHQLMTDANYLKK